MTRTGAFTIAGLAAFAISTGTLVLLLITGSETPRETMAFFALFIGYVVEMLQSQQ
ncbi:hypothetical protein [Micrococcus luteus]|uniref:hypothetical protein n=1 Tax=Micrococcus luteus TaxID=1270 RepID=UPI0020CC801A|nr:hypothetical protein [Micrococcus luteus]UTT45628.1 hypothetical protein NMQ02_11050 [Micrococcus luteus]